MKLWFRCSQDFEFKFCLLFSFERNISNEKYFKRKKRKKRNKNRIELLDIQPFASMENNERIWHFSRTSLFARCPESDLKHRKQQDEVEMSCVDDKSMLYLCCGKLCFVCFTAVGSSSGYPTHTTINWNIFFLET